MLTPITFRQLFSTAVMNCGTLFEASMDTGYDWAAFTTFQTEGLRILDVNWCMKEDVGVKLHGVHQTRPIHNVFKEWNGKWFACWQILSYWFTKTDFTMTLSRKDTMLSSYILVGVKIPWGNPASERKITMFWFYTSLEPTDSSGQIHLKLWEQEFSSEGDL